MASGWSTPMARQSVFRLQRQPPPSFSHWGESFAALRQETRSGLLAKKARAVDLAFASVIWRAARANA